MTTNYQLRFCVNIRTWELVEEQFYDFGSIENWDDMKDSRDRNPPTYGDLLYVYLDERDLE